MRRSTVRHRRFAGLLFCCAVFVGAMAFGAPVDARAHPSVSAVSTVAPEVPPAQICGNGAVLNGPAAPPPGAVQIPAGDNETLVPVANTTYWFAPGIHTFGAGPYGQVIPADNDVFVGAPGAILDGGRVNQYAFTQHAVGVTVEYLTIQNFGRVGASLNEGVVNASSGHDWTIQHNTIQDNAGAGLYIGSGDTVRYNCVAANEQAGFGAYEPGVVDGVVRDIIVDHNEIAGNNTYDWEAHYPGCGCVAGGKFWHVDGATVTNNWVHDNKSPGLWADTDNNDFDFQHNYINDNDGEGIDYEISYNALIKNNTFIHNGVVYGAGNPGFPTGAVDLSESGGDARIPGRYSTVRVIDNRFVNNWSGVVLWEDANRFCGSPGNTSSSFCTLGNPSQVDLSTCVAGTIAADPYYSDCRWKTQNVSVRENSFVIDPSTIAGCTPEASCGLQGLFSDVGTYPSWSPYLGPTVEQAITFHQKNHFNDNSYVGPWLFMAHDSGTVLSPAAWRANPYRQDTRSTFAAA